jgi:hypothetical protein
MTDIPIQRPSPDELTVQYEPEVFDFHVEPIPHPIDLFELSFPRPPQGTWRKRFDIRVDVRFAYMDLALGEVTVRVSTRGARLASACTGCSLLPHSLYGLNPLPSRNVVAVEEKQSAVIGASGTAQVQVKAGVFQGFDAGASLEAKASGEAARRIERQGTREESIPRVVPRPHGAWDLSEPHKDNGCLDGDYLTSRGQYREEPSNDPADLPLATVQAHEQADEVSVELTMEIQPRDLVFRKLPMEGTERHSRGWFHRETINTDLIARRLMELAHAGEARSEFLGQLRIRLGTTTLRGERRKSMEGWHDVLGP